MASKRRGGGAFRPPELKGTLGTLLRTAWQQAGGVREVLERGARQGRERLDGLRTDRRRQDLLAELGEVVLELIRRGEIDVGELPEAHEIVHELEHLDAGTDHDHHHHHDHDVATPPSRGRFDTRGREDDGTVASGARWSPPRPAAAQRVWRPPGTDDAPPSEVAAKPPRTIDRSVPMPKQPPKKGGITFDEDDEDLADYMHPDDVPPKGSTED